MWGENKSGVACYLLPLVLSLHNMKTSPFHAAVFPLLVLLPPHLLLISQGTVISCNKGKQGRRPLAPKVSSFNAFFTTNTSLHLMWLSNIATTACGPTVWPLYEFCFITPYCYTTNHSTTWAQPNTLYLKHYLASWHSNIELCCKSPPNIPTLSFPGYNSLQLCL